MSESWPVFNNGSTGQGYPRYGDQRSPRASLPSMPNYNEYDSSSGPKHYQDPYQQKPTPLQLQAHRDRGGHGSFSGPYHPSPVPGYSQYDSGGSGWHQTPGMSSGSGSHCPQCGSPSYGQGEMAEEWGYNARDPYSQAQRRFRCSHCGFDPTTAPYSQPAGTGPMPPADDFYNDRPFGSFSNHQSRANSMSRSGTGEVIRGHAPGTRDRGRGHGEGRAIAAAGGEEVEPGRGLDKLEDKYTRTSVVPVAHGPTGWDSNAPQTSTATVDPGTRAIIGVASAVGGAATLAAAAWGYSRR